MSHRGAGHRPPLSSGARVDERRGKRRRPAPDSLVEDEAAILGDTIRVIDAFHDPRDGSMLRVGVAPCSPFSVSRALMRAAALLARNKGVMLHTHLAENADDVALSLARFGCSLGHYAAELGWTGRVACPLREAGRA